MKVKVHPGVFFLLLVELVLLVFLSKFSPKNILTGVVGCFFSLKLSDYGMGFWTSNMEFRNFCLERHVSGVKLTCHKCEADMPQM